jgi:hypothetical protein
MFFHGFGNWDYGYKCHIPNVLVDNISLFNVKTKAPINDMEMNFFYGATNAYMHLESYQGAAAKVIIFSDKGGGTCVECVDELLESGAVGRDAKCDVCGAEGEYSIVNDSTGTWKLDHITDTYVKVPEGERVANRNDNPIGMPDYIKIVNIGADKNYTFKFKKQADPNASFAKTKFYYGEGANDYYQGTNHDSNNHIIFE